MRRLILVWGDLSMGITSLVTVAKNIPTNYYAQSILTNCCSIDDKTINKINSDKNIPS